MPIELSLDNSQRGEVRFMRKIFLLSKSKLTGAYIPENPTAKFYPKPSRIIENWQKLSCVWTKMWPKTHEGAEQQPFV